MEVLCGLRAPAQRRIKALQGGNPEFLQVLIRPGIGPVDSPVRGKPGQSLGKSGQFRGRIRREAAEGLH
jgi:hypothetical protein